MDKLQPGLGQRLKARRETLQSGAKAIGTKWRIWTQRALADQLGVEVETYQRWEYGQAEPDLATVLRLAKALGEEPAALIGITSPPAETKWTNMNQRKLAEVAMDETEKREGLERRVRGLETQIETLEAQVKMKNEALEFLIQTMAEDEEDAIFEKQMERYFSSFPALAAPHKKSKAGS